MTWEPVELPAPIPFAEQWCNEGKNSWNVPRLVALADQQKLPVIELPLVGMTMPSFKIKTMYDFAREIKAVLAADLSYPILLDGDGMILDGRHRMVRALVEGHPTIKARRFNELVRPDI